MIQMSDCSTNAMKPKAMDLHECVNCEHYCAECDSCCNGVPDHQDCMFRCWTPSCAHKLEQRYAQLEQVALRMFQKLDVRTTYKDEELDGIEEVLERLGVFDD